EELREAVRTSPVVNTDDTGWRIGGAAAFLMGFFTPLLAVFQIRWRHRHQEVVEMLGACFAGLLGTDRGTSYEADALDTIEQQKCLSHLLKNLSAVEEGKTGRAKAFPRELKATLREAVKLWRDQREQACTPEQYRERGRLIRQRLDRQLRDRRLKDPDNQRLLNGIGLQNDNGRVLLFLERPEIEPTNNRAERGLRGAVIARKVSHCSKNERGARTYEVMKSITATLALRGHQVSGALAGMIGGRPMPGAVAR
ncbi:MAG: IS66 family transposase, partial [Sphingobacteriales bacterium]